MRFYTNLGKEILSADLADYPGSWDDIVSVECYPSSGESIFEIGRKLAVKRVLIEKGARKSMKALEAKARG